tara:strand:+ start:1147 stop:1848 length:702 start_codon:yes stop_codon:yes gene_type:complete
MAPSVLSDENKETLAKDTRQRLLETAIWLFGEHGYASTSTRMLADAAEVNVSAIPYYFESKEGLYHAAIEYIVSEVKGALDEVFNSAEAALQKKLSAKQARTHLKAVLCRLVQLFTQSGRMQCWSVVIFKEQLRPSDGFNIIYDRLIQPHHQVIGRLLAIISDVEPDAPSIQIQAHMLIGQVVSLLSGRASLLRHMDAHEWNADDAHHIETVAVQMVDMLRPLKPYSPDLEGC